MYLKKHKLWVVFDGGSFPCARQESVAPGVMVIHAGFESSADAYIIHFMGTRSERPLIMVSSDGYLKKMSLSYHVTPVSSPDFWKLVREEFSELSQSFARSGIARRAEGVVSSQEVDALMESSVVPDKDAGIPQSISGKRAFSPSKKDRRHARIIKKL